MIVRVFARDKDGKLAKFVVSNVADYGAAIMEVFLKTGFTGALCLVENLDDTTKADA